MSTLLVVWMLAQVPAVPGAGVVQPVSAESVTTRAFGRVARLHVQPALLAEARPSAEFAQALRLAAPEAEVVSERRAVRVWRVHDAAAASAALPAALKARALPVMSAQAHSSAVAKVPVGGVVLALEAGVDLPGFLTAQGLVQARALEGGLVLVESAPGWPSLLLAQRLAGLPGVALARPELWTHGATR